MFNATPAIEKFKDTSIGVLTLSEIQLSSRDFIVKSDGTEISRSEF
jgi:hypothetical protein